MRKKAKRCECCNKILRDCFPIRKFCNYCGIYILDLRRKSAYYKKEMEKLKIEKYGTKRGSERLREKS